LAEVIISLRTPACRLPAGRQGRQALGQGAKEEPERIGARQS